MTEEPKTCGNCGHSISHWTPNCCVCMRGSDSVSIYNNDRAACSDWDEFSPLNIEQRYEQLEQVAKRMYDWCDGVANRYFTIVPETVRDFRKQLETLGVSVDD